MRDKLVRKLPSTNGGMIFAVDTGTTGALDTTGDILVADVREMTNMTIVVGQVTDAGTATINVEGTIDGTIWSLIGSALTEASFPAGSNTGAAAIGVSDARGMAMQFQQIRVRAVAIAGGGVYTAAIMGMLLGEQR